MAQLLLCRHRTHERCDGSCGLEVQECLVVVKFDHYRMLAHLCAFDIFKRIVVLDPNDGLVVGANRVPTYIVNDPDGAGICA
jgi:hypothetical protein